MMAPPGAPPATQEQEGDSAVSSSTTAAAADVDLILDPFKMKDDQEVSNNFPVCRVPDSKLTVSSSGVSYYLSWLQRSGKDAQKSWSDAVAFCKTKCMELVSVDSEGKADFLKEAVKEADVYGFWTGAFFGLEGRWQWQADGKAVQASTWSQGGRLQGHSQPDNYMGKASGGLTSERCAAVLNDWFGDGSKGLHDFVCQEKLPFVCQS